MIFRVIGIAIMVVGGLFGVIMSIIAHVMFAENKDFLRQCWSGVGAIVKWEMTNVGFGKKRMCPYIRWYDREQQDWNVEVANWDVDLRVSEKDCDGVWYPILYSYTRVRISDPKYVDGCLYSGHAYRVRLMYAMAVFMIGIVVYTFGTYL